VNTKRWAWLQLCEFPPGVKADGSCAIKSYYVPEDIIAHIPSYETQLHATIILNDDEAIIRDTVPRDPQAVSRAIRFLVSGYLPPVDACSGECAYNLHRLVDLYNFSITLSIKCLEVAVLDRLENLRFEALRKEIFFRFARRCYDEGTRHNSLQQLIKKKLSHLLPHLEQSMTAEQLSSVGGELGTELMVVLLEDRAKMRETPGPKIKTEVKRG
jgi:hypothetical protein